ncbi:MAG: rod shape-determining protein MreB [Parasphingorhabdus sp.]|jgi:rod shape-determining protein MreB|uniref:rod shape-determining protein n=1 Tax=Parasphingorhabdus sp. TaxID=2709688 RepID=UPI001B4C0977|nr:rod shape-determining protein [Parasphingorhabdus sp.]MBQ0771221.1 rod shape-determining protein [Sphingomonadales bacterium]|tara:strand:+ start:2383 stop:3417 length:1035 start_codon:yes stop_codon:yes gene_type:complete
MKSFFKLQSLDLAIDLGTANTLIYVRDRGIMLNEPSVVALETNDGVTKVRAVGSDAKLMMGKTPSNIRVVRPLKDGVIADLDVAEQMIKHFIHKVHPKKPGIFRRFDIVVCIPSGSTNVQLRALRDAASNAGASGIFFIEEPMAAAIGAGIPVAEPVGAMVVDIGGGTTEVAVLSLQGLAYSTSGRMGGDKIDDAIASYIRRKHNLAIGETTTELVKHEMASAVSPVGDGRIMHIKGRDLVSGMPKKIAITEAEIAQAIAEPIGQIAEAVLNALEHTKPELAADIMDQGIVLTGGGALLGRIDEFISEKTGLAVTIADDPLTCVAIGAGRALEEPLYRNVLIPA